MTSYLLLWLEAPLQSWGYDSKFDNRSTLNFPTKSGILGLICCALGAGGEQVEFLAKFASLQQKVIAYYQSDEKNRKKDILLQDFHMVGSGYDDKDNWQNLMIPKKSDGGKSVGGGAKLTYRYYLQNVTFAVILEVPNEERDRIINALAEPVWDIYLGRKTCVPTEKIYQGCFSSVAEAEEGVALIERNKLYVKKEFVVLDGKHEGEILMLNDVPLQFGTSKKYKERYVTVEYWDE